MKLRKASALFMAAAMSASMFVVPAAADETEDPAKAIPEDVIPDETVTLNVFDQLANYSGEQIGWFGQVMLEKFNVKLNIIPDSDGTYETRMESGDLGDLVIWGNDGIGFINLSGGVGIPYLPDQEGNDIAVIGEGVHKVYDEVLVPAGMGDVKIFTELGRYMLAPNGHLVTKAIHEKHTHKEYIGVDACAVNLMRPAMYGAYHHITVMGKENEPADHVYDITGSLCENNDKFAIDRKLPKIDMGDLLVIHDTGAHGFAMGYNYNGKLKSAEILLKEDGTTEMIRRAETPEDYFATIKGFNF